MTAMTAVDDDKRDPEWDAHESDTESKHSRDLSRVQDSGWGGNSKDLDQKAIIRRKKNCCMWAPRRPFCTHLLAESDPSALCASESGRLGSLEVGKGRKRRRACEAVVV